MDSTHPYSYSGHRYKGLILEAVHGLNFGHVPVGGEVTAPSSGVGGGVTSGARPNAVALKCGVVDVSKNAQPSEHGGSPSPQEAYR